MSTHTIVGIIFGVGIVAWLVAFLFRKKIRGQS